MPFNTPTSQGSTVGALEIGTLVAIYLCGLVTGQVYVYFQRCSTDPWGLKILVCVIWALDSGHTVAISSSLYTLTITQHGDVDMLPRALGIVGPLSQGWFAYRLYKFGKKLPLPMICLCLSLVRVGGSIALSTIGLSLRGLPLSEFEARVGWLITAILTIGVSVDFILAVTLCYYLCQWRHGPFNRFVTQFMVWTLGATSRSIHTPFVSESATTETGSITMFGALALLITVMEVEHREARLTIFSE
ncbi:hypothetical protein DFH07DRAFT_769364 [Mycena maculata]|uniref:Uncharacterized protein n=1 Tax=Mycena maculata TaxID=230809 RepID=A0AAD7JPZ0_9AGAR|nr:hypothetical protein DFH07DRAFT_769364 [Mycena maculata]